MDNSCNCWANYTRMKIYMCLLVSLGNTLWETFFHYKICGTALICQNIQKKSHWCMQRWIFHWYLTLICEYEVQQKKQGNWRRPERRTFHCFEMHIFLTALLNNCSGWKSLTLCILATECKCSITKEIRELQVQGPLFQVRKQKPQVFRRCSENIKRLTSEMRFISSCKFLH